MSIRVCLAGVTGDVGRLLTAAILEQEDLTLTSAVARSAAGRTVGQTLACDSAVEIRRSVAEAAATDSFDVLVDYTSARAAYGNVQTAVSAGKHAVIGSSGIATEQFAQLNVEARSRGVGLLHGNFAITAVLAQMFAAAAACYIKSWEIIEYAHDDKIDAVSGTARELAHRLAKHGPPQHALSPDSFVGDCRSRGAMVQGTQVHAIRLPGLIFGFEVLFGRSQERLTIRHEVGSHAEPYIEGTLLAIRKVPELVGLHRGLESVLDLRCTDAPGRASRGSDVAAS